MLINKLVPKNEVTLGVWVTSENIDRVATFFGGVVETDDSFQGPLREYVCVENKEQCIQILNDGKVVFDIPQRKQIVKVYKEQWLLKSPDGIFSWCDKQDFDALYDTIDIMRM